MELPKRPPTTDDEAEGEVKRTYLVKDGRLIGCFIGVEGKVMDPDTETLLNQNRRLIATVQALIATHRYPDMYNVEGVVEDAEATWRQANETQMRLITRQPGSK